MSPSRGFESLTLRKGDTMLCIKCRNKVDSDSQFCKYCGAPVHRLSNNTVPAPPYNNLEGWWKVTTEGDCEGRSTVDLGVHHGWIDEIAHNLSPACFYSLNFTAVPDPREKKKISGKKSDSVHVVLHIDSKTWDLSQEDRMAMAQSIFKDRPVEVTKGTYYASFVLNFLEEAKA